MPETPKFIIPFLVPAPTRTEPFTPEMEKAAVYSLAETERSKGGGILLKKQTEKLRFLAEFGYPLWLTPWNDITLIIDGLKPTASNLAYENIADVETFEQNLLRSSKSQENYVTFLSENLDYFRINEKQKSISTVGLKTESRLLDELQHSLASAKQTDPSVSEAILLSSVLDHARILAQARELDAYAAKFKKETNMLYEDIKTIDNATKNFAKIARDRIQAIKDQYRSEIVKQEKIVAPKITSLNDLSDQQVTQATKNYQRQLLPVQKDKVKLEKTKEQAIGKIEKAKAQAKASAARKDETREKKWKEKADESKKELSQTEQLLKQVDKTIKSIEENRTTETFKIKSEWEAKINESRKDIVELENQRDARIQLAQQEIDKLETLTTTSIQQITTAVKQRENDLSNIERLGIKQKRKETVLVYVPFYVASYQAGSRKRFAIFTPSCMNSIGLSTKIIGALGRARYKKMLAPRFDGISQLLRNVTIIAEQKVVLAREIDEAGSNNDLMKTEETRALVKSGLDKIRQEGWFSDKEYDALIGTLAGS